MNASKSKIKNSRKIIELIKPKNESKYVEEKLHYYHDAEEIN